MPALIMTYLTILGFLGLITLPVTGPAVITAGGIIRRQTWVCSTARGQGRLVLAATD
ncbi:MAG TPA: hypothetical protein VGH69_19925 [Mycobacterium sp.]|jgi:hypothetical protein